MKIGIQLYSCIDKIGTVEDLCSTLKAIGQMGYQGVEFISFGGYGAMDPSELKKTAEACGLEVVNVHLHIPFEKWSGDDLEDVLSYARDVGLKVVTLPYLPEELRTPEVLETIIRKTPDWIRLCRSYGLEFCYHNHDFEFEPYADTILLEAIANTSPDMKIELDTFWAFFAGYDPCAMMEKLGEKLRLIHVKDYNILSSFHEMKFTAIGTGIMDNKAVVEKAAQMGQEWIIVEQDNSAIDTLESAKLSLDGLRRIMQ